jgi:hypothetical protein
MARTADTAKTATAHQRAGILLLLPRANEAPSLLGRSLLPHSRNGGLELFHGSGLWCRGRQGRSVSTPHCAGSGRRKDEPQPDEENRERCANA